MSELMTGFWVIAGLLLLIFGRKLFWLYVALIGFVFGFHMGGEIAGAYQDWVILLIAFSVGAIGALLAVFLQIVAIGLSGFLAGCYIVAALFQLFQMGTGDLFWIAYVIGGIIGAVTMYLIFDWALILISALAGALLMVQGIALILATGPQFNLILAALLFLVGIVIQAWMFKSGEQAQRRT